MPGSTPGRRGPVKGAVAGLELRLGRCPARSLPPGALQASAIGFRRCRPYGLEGRAASAGATALTCHSGGGPEPSEGQSFCARSQWSHPPEGTRALVLNLRITDEFDADLSQTCVLEASARASCTVPLVSKVCGLPMACVGTQLMLGAKLKHLNLQRKRVLHAAVKEVVLRFNMFSGTGSSAGCPDALAGRGLGLAPTFGLAYCKAQEAAGRLPTQGPVFSLSPTATSRSFWMWHASLPSWDSASRPPQALTSSCASTRSDANAASNCTRTSGPTC